MDTSGRAQPAKAKTGDAEPAANFIRDIIIKDVQSNKNQGRVATRFPPEPNGYLHIGHAKAFCLNFGMAAEFNGTCNLRLDDTNPTKEEVEYVDSIKQDIHWMGFDWENRLYYASDYFEELYQYAVQLIKVGKAYVCCLPPDKVSEYRGVFGRPGTDSPYRNRPIEENLKLFEAMRRGELEEGTHVLRAKIDMASPNMNMRDPTVFRILKIPHHRTGDKWCIYPMYDFAHCLSDSIEGITHSLCSIEFEDHRPLYDWFLDQLDVPCHPQQIEFARLNLSYTILSKRYLQQLIDERYVTGWNDPRMPTLSGMKRRGYTPNSIKTFMERIGIAKKEGVVDVSLLEFILREELNAVCPRVMAVLNPLKIVIDNYPEGETEQFDAPYHPEDPSMGSRKVPFSRVLYIERDDFREDPPKKWFRLAPGSEIRLRYACLIKFVKAVKDDQTGEILEVHCTWDPESRGGNSPDGRRVRGTSHWVSAEHAIDAEVRLYDRLFNKPHPMNVKDGNKFTDHINPYSLKTMMQCKLEPSLAGAQKSSQYQFERLGYFCVDSVDSTEQRLVFNRTISLRDSWEKIEKSS